MTSHIEGYVVGYVDRFSYRPGDVVSCKASATEEELAADVVRLLRGTGNDALASGYGPRVDTIAERVFSVSEQGSSCGSYMIALEAIHRPVQDVALSVRIWPTEPQGDCFQGVITLLDGTGRVVLTLGIDPAGVPAVRKGSGEVLVSGGRTLQQRRWYSIRLTADRHRSQLRVCALAPLVSEVEEDVTTAAGCDASTARHVLVAAVELSGELLGRAVCAYNGKMERPSVSSSGAVLAEWAFELAPHRSLVEDISGSGAHGKLINSPTRAVTGSRWDGTVVDPRADPAHYAAIHFHTDDLANAHWESSVEIPLPFDLPSGVYAVRLRARTSGLCDLVPFIVQRTTGQKPPVVLLLPTFTYQAYANLQPPDDAPHPFDPRDRLQREHPEFGKSLYDEHDDGSGVCLATLARPMLQVRPGYRSWLTGCPRHFSADLFLVEWLDRQGIEVDVVCDHDVEEDPAGALGDYQVVLTGSHPEYCTGRLLDALENHVAAGGNLMYLGGNGFYWVTSCSPDNPDLIEVRRYVGTRTWDGQPGERYHATTGEYGGLWHDRGRAPNRLVGVGMTAQGWDGAVGYRRTAEAYNPEWSWVFEGVKDETLGDYGFCLGGASGDEIDRFDLRRGSSPDGVVLATSLPHSAGYHAVVEEVLAVEGDLSAVASSRVRSDMVMLAHASGGRAFSVGSISFIGSLMWNDGDNGISHAISNVLREFMSGGRQGSHRDS